MARITEKTIYRQLYPELYGAKGRVRPHDPLLGFALNEVCIRPRHSHISPFDVDLSANIGPVSLGLPIFSAAMDALSGSSLLTALSELGGCGISYRSKKSVEQLEIMEKALNTPHCLVLRPKCLHPEQALEDAKDILDEFGFSTIPVITEDGSLVGVLFTRDIAFRDVLDDPVKKWMKPFKELKTESDQSDFSLIKDRLLNEQECNVLPIIDRQQHLKGIYFMVDFFHADPSSHNGRPLCGLAIGVHADDLKRAAEGLEMGAGVICIDSSHGNNPAVISQAAAAVKLAKGRAAVLAGNIADVDGYLRLAAVGVDGVKCGIGSGAICTTSLVTGAGFPMFTLIRELFFARRALLKAGKNAPIIIPDGGINGPGPMSIAICAGGHALMAGKWLVAASESLSWQKYPGNDGFVDYWGMASPRAIRARLSSRYGKQKKAPEGVEGKVKHRGNLRKWLPLDIELTRGGLAHMGAKDIDTAHRLSEDPLAFCRFTAAGQNQNAISV